MEGRTDFMSEFENRALEFHTAFECSERLGQAAPLGLSEIFFLAFCERWAGHEATAKRVGAVVEFPVENCARQCASASPAARYSRARDLAAENLNHRVVTNPGEHLSQRKAEASFFLGCNRETLSHRVGGANFVVVVEPIIEEGPADQHLLE